VSPTGRSPAARKSRSVSAPEHHSVVWSPTYDALPYAPKAPTTRLGITRYEESEVASFSSQVNAASEAVDTKPAVFEQGTFDARPAFGIQRRYYLATDGALSGCPEVISTTAPARNGWDSGTSSQTRRSEPASLKRTAASSGLI
jgi:hypothetical protein